MKGSGGRGEELVRIISSSLAVSRKISVRKWNKPEDSNHIN